MSLRRNGGKPLSTPIVRLSRSKMLIRQRWYFDFDLSHCPVRTEVVDQPNERSTRAIRPHQGEAEASGSDRRPNGRNDAEARSRNLFSESHRRMTQLETACQIATRYASLLAISRSRKTTIAVVSVSAQTQKTNRLYTCGR